MVRGRDVYGLTATILVHAAELLRAPGFDRAGALAPAEAFEPRDFLDHLSEHGVAWERAESLYLGDMSSEDPFGGLFGDPDELRRRMAEFAEQMQGAQKVAWADNAIKLAVDMTVAGLARLNLQGNAEQQAQDLLQAMRLMFPEAVILVREAREGFGDLASASSSSATAAPSVGAVLAAARDHLLEAADAEDEDERREADAEGEHADRDLLAHRVGGHGRAGAPCRRTPWPAAPAGPPRPAA